MDAKKALIDYRDNSPAVVREYVESFRDLSVDERLELLAHMLIAFQTVVGETVLGDSDEDAEDLEYFTH